jgi:MoaA/NifB/PqqE/SkfB family radical SAM enzyme
MNTLPDRSVTHVGKLYCHICTEVQQLSMTISDDKQNPLISKFNPPVSKKCRIYRKRKLLTEFEVDESTKDRHNVICKDCKAEESWGGCCRDHF